MAQTVHLEVSIRAVTQIVSLWEIIRALILTQMGGLKHSWKLGRTL